MQGVCRVTLLLLALAGGGRVQAQLVADVRQFLGTLPTFYSVDRGAASPPQAPGPAGAASVNLLSVATNATALMNSLLSVPVNSSTHEWAVTDPSLGAGVQLGPDGAAVLTRDPTKGQDAYEQALRVGPDGVVVGPNTASARVNRTADLAQGTLGVQNVHVGSSGVLVNNGSPLNSSVKVTGDGLMIQGNPTGSGQSHFYLKPNLRLGDQQVAGQAANGSLNNVQISLGDSNKTAGEQTRGFRSYELHGNGTAGGASAATRANPYFATNSAGQARVWAPAAAPGRAPRAAAAAPSASALAADAGDLPLRFDGASAGGAAAAGGGGAGGGQPAARADAAATPAAAGAGAGGQDSGEILPSPAVALPAEAEAPDAAAPAVEDGAQAQRAAGPSAAPDSQAAGAGAGQGGSGLPVVTGAAAARGATGRADAGAGGRRMLRSWSMAAPVQP